MVIIKFAPDISSNLVKPGEALTLSMNFTSQLSAQMKGFYYSSYVEDAEEKFVAVTQMEPTDARRAFPCFDEPNMKATFSISIGHHRNMIALSNMPIQDTTPIEGMDDFVWDNFSPTVPMSTYLVAAAVGDYIRVDATDASIGKWAFNIYVRRSAANQAKYAKNIAPRIQAFYEKYFQIAFPLPKQDIIAIRDFSYEAMENWGLVVHSETALLFDEKFSSASDKQYVLELIAHELAHQWFGNLVTMDWWSDLWLNEGFANYIQYLGAQHVEPEFGMLEQFVAAELHESMAIDYFESSHPISQEVRNAAEINEIFDLISYRKGASVIRMLVNFLGEDVFREGVTNYLETNKFANAVQDDLWDALSRAAERNKVPLPVDVGTIMNTWTLQKGYPVVTLKRDYITGEITITQGRFTMGGGESAQTANSVWWIPLTYTCESGALELTWLGTPEGKVKSPISNISAPNDQWIIANFEEIGYFRVNYDVQNWKLITNQLMTKCDAIQIINRAQIIDDASNLARAGLLDYGTFLDLTSYLVNEEEYLPWHAAFVAFEYLSSMLSRRPEYGQFKKHLLKIVRPIYSLLGFDKQSEDTHLVLKKRALVIKWASFLGVSDCTTKCLQSFAQWMNDSANHRIDCDLKETIIGTALSHGGEAEWDFAFQRYLESNVASEQVAILSALCCTREAWLLSRMLEWTIDPTSGIRKQDAPLVFRRVAANEMGRSLAFSFMCERWEELTKVFVTFNSLADVVGWVTESFNTEWEKAQLEKFLNMHEDVLIKKATRSTLQIMERVSNNVEWIHKFYPQVKSWLQ